MRLRLIPTYRGRIYIQKVTFIGSAVTSELIQSLYFLSTMFREIRTKFHPIAHVERRSRIRQFLSTSAYDPFSFCFRLQRPISRSEISPNVTEIYLSAEVVAMISTYWHIGLKTDGLYHHQRWLWGEKNNGPFYKTIRKYTNRWGICADPIFWPGNGVTGLSNMANVVFGKYSSPVVDCRK